jgi:formylglycine-generating enzyme required for sulfatase activity
MRRVPGWVAPVLIGLGLAGCAHGWHRALPEGLTAGMVRVPGGPFVMGQDPEDGPLGMEVGVDSIPRHQVNVGTFWIDRTETTVAEYRAFTAATGHRDFPEVAYNHGPPRPDDPVFGVAYADAAAYCAWRGKRLPTEAEWEKAARGTDGRLYPWGNAWEPGRVAFEQRGRVRPDPVGSHPENASPYGALDMAGNVMEWTSSWYQAYPGNDLKRRSFGEHYRVLKGGSWESEPYQLRAANRFAVVPEIGQPSFGVRCVVSWQR